MLVHADDLAPDMVRDTLNVLLKFETDIDAIRPQIAELTRKARQDGDRGYAATT